MKTKGEWRLLRDGVPVRKGYWTSASEALASPDAAMATHIEQTLTITVVEVTTRKLKQSRSRRAR